MKQNLFPSSLCRIILIYLLAWGRSLNPFPLQGPAGNWRQRLLYLCTLFCITSTPPQASLLQGIQVTASHVTSAMLLWMCSVLSTWWNNQPNHNHFSHKDLHILNTSFIELIFLIKWESEQEGYKDHSTNKPTRYSINAVQLKASDNPNGGHSLGNSTKMHASPF